MLGILLNCRSETLAQDKKDTCNSQEAALEKEYQQISSQKECAITHLNAMLHLMREGNHMDLF